MNKIAYVFAALITTSPAYAHEVETCLKDVQSIITANSGYLATASDGQQIFISASSDLGKRGLNLARIAIKGGSKLCVTESFFKGDFGGGIENYSLKK